MKRIFALTSITFLLTLLFNACNEPAPVTDEVGFEELSLEDESYWNGSDLTGGFTSGNIYFPNNYVASGDYWSGFSYSNITDDSTAGYQNQYACIAGSGITGSANYAVLYSWSTDTLYFTLPEKITGISFCNTTWAYNVMKFGDSSFFIEKMGGEDGSSQDYFKLIIKGLDENDNEVGQYDFYLADFDSTRTSTPYIINSWTGIDLSEWDFISKLVFSFETNVADEYGPLIPTYVCIDNIEGIIDALE